ncbi:MAG: 50S ribosomal protein L4, partial [Planctomycetes bacterium]|nr:50S ribosomal protein L4 [Planctomycetota bacterium]
SDSAMVVDELRCPEPRTKAFAAMLAALGVRRGCLLAMDERSTGVYLSGRNIPNTIIRLVDELNAYEILRQPKLVFTKAALERLLRDPVRLGGASVRS